MYAVVNTGGKQYKVGKGDIFRIEKIPGEVGASVVFDKVLMFSDGKDVRIGQPLLDDVSVEGHIVEQDRANKVIVFKYKKRKRYRRKQGHRQYFTAVQIDAIKTPGSDEAESESAMDAQADTPVVEAEAAPEESVEEKTEE